MKRFAVVAILFFAFCGLADATYLTQSELNNTPLLCNIQNLSGCNIVTNSQYSRVFGIPVAELGLPFYGIIFILASLEIVLMDSRLRRALQGLALIGILVSLYSTGIQIFVIKAFCIYCLASTFASLFIFILASLIEPIRMRRMRSASTMPDTVDSSPHLSMPPTA